MKGGEKCLCLCVKLGGSEAVERQRERGRRRGGGERRGQVERGLVDRSGVTGPVLRFPGRCWQEDLRG